MRKIIEFIKSWFAGPKVEQTEVLELKVEQVVTPEPVKTEPEPVAKKRTYKPRKAKKK